MRNWELILVYVFLIFLAVFTVLPFFWSVFSSFKPMEKIFESTLSSLLNVRDFTATNYSALFKETFYPRWFRNSLFVAISYSLLVLFLCSLGGYAFAKFNFPGKDALFSIVIASMTIPIWGIIIPLFAWFSRLGLIDTYWALVLPGSANGFGIFLMRQYIQSVPSEILDSARIDGCSEFQVFWKIVFPVIKPASAALLIWAFLNSWNNLLGPLVFIRSPKMFTIPAGLASFVGQKDPQFGLLIAGGIVSLLPVLTVFILLQREFIAGLTLGAVKE